MRTYYDVIDYTDNIREIRYSTKDYSLALSMAENLHKQGRPVYINKTTLDSHNRLKRELLDPYGIEPQFVIQYEEVETKPKRKAKKKSNPKKSYHF